MLPVKPVFLCLFLFLLLGSACQPVVQPSSPPVSEQETGYTPRYEAADCQYPIPEGEVIECGYLVVPEDRTQPDGPAIRLHVVNFKSLSENPAPDPIFFVHGGPAAGGSVIVDVFTNDPHESALRGNRDNLYLEYRGANYSEPAFYCPEMEADVAQFAGMTFSEEIEWSGAAIQACAERLAAEGANLSAYTPLAAAADLADLRIALGYEEINVNAVSYGTLIAMLMAAYYPEGIRSVVLDSVNPPDTNWLDHQLETAYSSFNALFAACAADPVCDEAYPDLENAFYEVLATLRAEPVTVTLDDGAGGSIDVLVDDLKFAQQIRDGMFFADSFTYMPAAIYAAYEGDYQGVAQAWMGWVGGRHGEAAPGIGGTTQGVYYSMMCLHDGTFTDFEAAKAGYDEIGGDPSLHEWAVASFLSDTLAACEHWGLTAPEPNIEIQPVDTDVPVLMLTGSFDPDLSPFMSQQYIDRFPNGYYYELPFGHVLLFAQCGMAITVEFLANPNQAPDANCIDEMTPTWYLPESSAAEVESSVGKILQVHFQYDITADEYRGGATSLAETFAALEGMRWKIWTINEETGEAGGIFLFDDEASRQGYLDGLFAEVVGGNPAFHDAMIKKFDVIEDATQVTHGPVGIEAEALSGAVGKILQVHFQYDITSDEYRAGATALAETFAQLEGMRWKIWTINEETGEAGGIFLFDDEASRQGYLDGLYAEVVGGNPAFHDAVIKKFDVIEDATQVTHGPVGVAGN